MSVRTANIIMITTPLCLPSKIHQLMYERYATVYVHLGCELMTFYKIIDFLHDKSMNFCSKIIKMV